MESKIYHYLHKDAMDIRREVFMNEQGFKNEFDSIDETCAHLVLYEDGTPLAVCRIFPSGAHCCSIGRIAVLKDYRGRGLGGAIVQEAEQYIRQSGGKMITLSAQVRVKGFYESLGYHAEGEEYPDEGCPHIKMIKEI